MSQRHEPPYDWEKNHSEWGKGSSAPVTHYELNAILMPIEGKIRVLHERIELNEDRLVEVRVHHFITDIFASFWTKILVVALAIMSAYILTNILQINVTIPFG